ncbi:acyltransferase [Paenibacillus sp. LjRoot153]|uniref:acyltransferase family protein n=1 Tax=Paenibacillus sp. LjRoot153 TaxID=3342270 RepID=UPI003ED0A183
MKQKQRHHELDSIRGLAALIVFLSHAVGIIPLNNSLDLINHSILHVFWDGTASVILFFVLSGYCLVLPFIRKEFNFSENVIFILKRIFRIYPAYWVVIFITIFLKNLFFNVNGLNTLSMWINSFWNQPVYFTDIFKHILLIGPLNPNLLNPVIWSLAVEMKISIIFPFIAYLVTKTRTVYGSLSLLLVSIIICYSLKQINFVSFIPLFILGALMAKYYVNITNYFRTLSKFSLTILFFIGLILYSVRYCIPNLKMDDTVINYLIGIGCSIFIYIGFSINKISNLLSNNIFRFIGNISYSFYLIHLPILISITSFLYQYNHSIILCWVISLIMSLLIAFILYKYIELPFIQIGRTIADSYTVKVAFIKKIRLLKIFKS